MTRPWLSMTWSGLSAFETCAGDSIADTETMIRAMMAVLMRSSSRQA
jgi:hypothetical protein